MGLILATIVAFCSSTTLIEIDSTTCIRGIITCATSYRDQGTLDETAVALCIAGTVPDTNVHKVDCQDSLFDYTVKCCYYHDFRNTPSFRGTTERTCPKVIK